MFWAHNQYSPQIDTILAKEDLTLNELFNQDCLFQELKSPNKSLIEFITRSDMLTELVRLVTEEPPQDLDVKERYRLPNLACEVLTTDTPLINEKLSEHTHLTRLYSFLDAEPPLNPLLASFFARTFTMLICRKHDQNWYSYQYTCLQVLDFLKSRESSLSQLVRHMGTSAIMELTLKLLTQIEGPDLQNTLIYLLEQESLIDKLIDLLKPSVDEDRNLNVSALLVDIVFKAKDDIGTNGGDSTVTKRRDTNPILEMIQSETMVKKLLENVFGEEVSESSIVAGVAVLLALICPPPMPTLGRRDLCDNFGSPCGGGLGSGMGSGGSGDLAKVARNQASLQHILLAIVPYLPRIHQLLLNPPKRDSIKLTYGTLDPPLGQARLALVKLLAVLISTDLPDINMMLHQLEMPQLLLDLFFKYRWNNFLHSQVDKCLKLDMDRSFTTVEACVAQAQSLAGSCSESVQQTQSDQNRESQSLERSQPIVDNSVQEMGNDGREQCTKEITVMDETISDHQPLLINPLVRNIFIKCKLIQRIMEASKENEAEQNEGERRRGYMGHLMSIAAHICSSESRSQALSHWMDMNVPEETLSEWSQWKKNVLTPYLLRLTLCLGGLHPADARDNDVTSVGGEILVGTSVSLASASSVVSASATTSQSDIMQKMGKIGMRLRGEFYLTSEDLRNFSENSNQSELSPFLESEFIPAATFLSTLQSDGSITCDADTFDDEEVWHEMHGSNDNSLDAASNSSDEEEKDCLNDVWSNCNSGVKKLELDAGVDPWGKNGSNLTDETTASSEEGWADFNSVPAALSYAQVLLQHQVHAHGLHISNPSVTSTMATATPDSPVPAGAIDIEDDSCRFALDGSLVLEDENEEPPQLFEVSPEPADQDDCVTSSDSPMEQRDNVCMSDVATGNVNTVLSVIESLDGVSISNIATSLGSPAVPVTASLSYNQSTTPTVCDVNCTDVVPPLAPSMPGNESYEGIWPPLSNVNPGVAESSVPEQTCKLYESTVEKESTKTPESHISLSPVSNDNVESSQKQQDTEDSSACTGSEASVPTSSNANSRESEVLRPCGDSTVTDTPQLSEAGTVAIAAADGPQREQSANESKGLNNTNSM